MDGAATDDGAAFEAASFLRHFNDMPDPRQRGKVTCPLAGVRLPALLGVLAGADSFVEIARFGDSGRSWAARRRTISTATSSPRWMPSTSSAASSPGSAR